MKHSFFIKRYPLSFISCAFAFLLSYEGQAQSGNLRNDGSYINIKTGTSLITGGNLRLENNGRFDNAGSIIVNGDWINNSGTEGFVTTTTDGSANFSGSNQSIGGTSATTFNDVNMLASGTKTINNGPRPAINGNLIVGDGTSAVVLINQNTDSLPILIGGNLTVETNSTYQNDGTGFDVHGNMVINGSFTGTKNLSFGGSADQTLSGSAFSSINNLTLNKPAGALTLNAAVTVKNTLTLTKGNIISTDANLLTLDSTGSVNGGDSTSFVAGPMKKIGNTAFTFPTGKGTNYQPIGISAPANSTDAFKAEYFDSAQTSGNNSDSTIGVLGACEYWNLDPVSGTSSVTVTGGWNNNSCNVADSIQNMTAANWDGSVWRDAGGTNASGNRSHGTISSIILIPIGPIIFVPKCKMPISINTGANGSTFCSGLQTVLTASATSFFTVNSYSWKNSANTILSTTNTVTVGSTDVYTARATNTIGCVATKTISITVNANPSVSVTPTSTAICNGNNTSLVANGATTYSWTPSTGLNATTGANVTASPISNITYTVTGTTLGCNGTATSTITVNSLPNVASTSTTVCSGQSATITASGADSYSWNTGATTAGLTVNPATVTATYTVTGTNTVTTCTNTATGTITVNTASVSVTPTATTICNGSSAGLTASGATTYSWTPSAGLDNTSSPNVIASPTVSTTYTVSGTDANGCSATAVASVSIFTSSLAANAGPDQVIISGGTAILDGTGSTPTPGSSITGYLWNPGSISTATFTTSPITTSVTYTLIVTETSGCTASDEVNLLVQNALLFAVLDKKTNAGYYNTYNSKLYFKYEGEYRNGSQLNYKVYSNNSTSNGNAVAGHTLTNISTLQNDWKYGDNRYELNVSALASGYYTLEVKNEKEEKFYLRFKK